MSSIPCFWASRIRSACVAFSCVSATHLRPMPRTGDLTSTERLVRVLSA